MPHRMEIELTSAKDDDTFTWRAAGARQPRGSVANTVLPGGSKVGDVLRVEAEVEIDGITILSVLPPKPKDADAGRIEVIGPPRPAPGVTTVLAERRKGRRPRDDEPGATDRRPRRDMPGRERPGEHRPRRDAAGERAEAPRDRRSAPGGERGRPGRNDRPGGTDTAAEGSRAGTAPPSRRPASTEQRPAARRGPRRLEPGTKHRDTLFASLSPEQRSIAERLAMGGLPSVRKAISEEQQRAKAEGRPASSGDPIVAIAEQLLPDVRAAMWLDRAEAAAQHVDDLGLRDLRATVAAAEPRTEQARDLQRSLKEGLERRVNKLREGWEEQLRQALGDGRVLQALRLSARPPEATARFPAPLVEDLSSRAGAAMTADTAPERWLALLEAAVASPVRRQIKPAGIPPDPTGQVTAQARLAAGRVPALAPLLGMAMPPPPKPLAGERPLRRSRPSPGFSPQGRRPGGSLSPGRGRHPTAAVPAERPRPDQAEAVSPPVESDAEPGESGTRADSGAGQGGNGLEHSGLERAVLEQPSHEAVDQR